MSTATASDRINEKLMITQIRRTWSLFFVAGYVVEVRIFLRQPTRSPIWGGANASVICGYFDSCEKLVSQFVEIEKKYGPEGSYITINPVDPRLAGRAHNRFIFAKKGDGASDNDIVHRNWLMIDLDPIRPSGINASEAEVKAAGERCDLIVDALIKRGWPDPVRMFSGNGYHLFYRLDMGNSETHRDLAKEALLGLQLQFSDKDKQTDLGSTVLPVEIGVKLDAGVFNAGRITKLYGSWARKGDEIEDRFHRQSCVDPIMTTPAPVPPSLLDREAEIYRSYKREEDGEKQKKNSGGSGSGIIDRFKKDHALTDQMSAYGYKHAHGDRWNHPEGDGKSVLVNVEANQTKHFSSNDPMFNGHRRDAWDYEVHFKFNGDQNAALDHWASIYKLPRKGLAQRNGQTNGHVNGHVNGSVNLQSVLPVVQVVPAITAPPVVQPKPEIKPADGQIIKLTYRMLVEKLKQRIVDSFDKEFGISCIRELEVGDAKILTEIARDYVAYDHAEESWYWFNNIYWQKDSTKNIYHLVSGIMPHYYKHMGDQLRAEFNRLREILKKGHEEKIAERAAFLDNMADAAHKRSKVLCNISNTRNCIVYAQAGEQLGLVGDEWDKNMNLLACQNAIIDLKAGKPVTPVATQYIRMVTNVSYDPNAKCELFKKTSIEICNSDMDRFDYIKRTLGYSMSGLCTESDFYIWLGREGRNGKELILGLISEVLGEKMTGVLEPELLLVGGTVSKNGPSEQKMTLRGRRIAWASEIAPGRLMDIAAMKDFSGGKKMQARPNNEKQAEWLRTHTLFMITNNLPKINNQSASEWDRIKIVRFDLTFTDNPDPSKPWERKKDTTLWNRICETELSGILNWLIEGYHEYLAGGLQAPTIVREETARYRKREDVLSLFFNECCYFDPDVETKRMDLFTAYKAQADERSSLGKIRFYEEVESRPGIKMVSAGNETFFRGIGLKY